MPDSPATRVGSQHRLSLTAGAAAEMMGVTLTELADLARMAAEDVDVPTVAQFRHRLAEVDSIKRNWPNRRSLLDAVVEEFGDRPLDAIKPRDVER